MSFYGAFTQGGGSKTRLATGLLSHRPFRTSVCASRELISEPRPAAKTDFLHISDPIFLTFIANQVKEPSERWGQKDGLDQKGVPQNRIFSYDIGSRAPNRNGNMWLCGTVL